MRIYWKYYLIPFVYGIIFSWYGTFHVSGMQTLRSLVADMGGLPGEINPRSVASLLEEKLPYILFIIFFSTYIYRHFCNCSAYVFSRCEKRGCWYVKEVVKLFFYSLLYVIVLVFGRMLPGLMVGQFIFDSLGWYLLAHYIATMVLWVFQLVLIANLVAIFWGSSLGCIVAVSLHVISTISLIGIDCEHLTGWNLKRLVWNSSSYLVFDWHHVMFEGEPFLGSLSYSLSFTVGYLYFIVLGLAAILAGYIIFQRVEIIQSDREK